MTKLPYGLPSETQPRVLRWRDLGRISYADGRLFQERLINERLHGATSDLLLFCEHPPVLTFGRRTSAATVAFLRQTFSAEQIDVLPVSRGGEATWHGPGQIIVYPVISLRERRLGVRRFVELGLQALQQSVACFGLQSEPKLTPAGLWVGPKKIGSVGLEVRHGITSHGFALNLNCDVAPFSRFAACGLEPGIATTVQNELGKTVAYHDISPVIGECFSQALELTR